MNDSIYGLTASIWTHDIDRAAEIGSRVETGTVYMNCCVSRPAAHLDRRQGHRPRRSAVEIRVRRADAAEELSPPRSLIGFISEPQHEHTDRQLELPDRRQIRRRPYQGARRRLPQRGYQSAAAGHRRGAR